MQKRENAAIGRPAGAGLFPDGHQFTTPDWSVIEHIPFDLAEHRSPIEVLHLAFDKNIHYMQFLKLEFGDAEKGLLGSNAKRILGL